MKKIPAVSTGQVQLFQTVLIAGAVIFVYLNAKKGVVAVAENAEQVLNTTKKVVTEDINPVHNQNIINRGFTSLYQKMTGSKGTLGTDIADWVHGTPEI